MYKTFKIYFIEETELHPSLPADLQTELLPDDAKRLLSPQEDLR